MYNNSTFELPFGSGASVATLPKIFSSAGKTNDNERRIAELMQQLEMKDLFVSRLKKELTEKEVKNVFLSQALDEKEKIIEEKEEKIIYLRGEKDQMIAEKEKLINTIRGEKDERIKELKEELKEYKDKLIEIKREYKELQEEFKKSASAVSIPMKEQSPPKARSVTPKQEKAFESETPSGKPEKTEKKNNKAQKNAPKAQKYDENSSVLSIRFLPKNFDREELRELISQFGEIEYLRSKEDKEKTDFIFANCKIHGTDSAQKASDYLEQNKKKYPFLKDIASWVKIDKSVLRMARLPPESDAPGIKNLLGSCGTVLDVKVAPDMNDKNKLFATVEFEGRDTALVAQKFLNEMKPKYEYMKDFSCWVVRPDEN